MRRERLGLGHRPLLHTRLRLIASPVSEFSFANLYLFRDTHEYEVLFVDDEVFVSGLSYERKRYLMPTTETSRISPAALKAAMQGHEYLYPVPEEWLPDLEPYGAVATFDEGDSDYIYEITSMRTFAGRRLHSKRNLLKQFTSLYRNEALPLTPERIPDALRVLDEWLSESGKGPTDYASCREALERSEELDLCGGIYYAEGLPAGFVLGEERPPDVYVLHFAKALTRYKGIYQFIFNNFAGILPETYRYINLEQDLNIEALRHAKLSYQPDRMVRKARVVFQQAV